MIGFVILFILNWLLGLDLRRRLHSRARSTASPSRSATRTSPGAARTRPGDLATAVEESVHGIRVLKAFGRGKHALEASRRRPSSCGAPRSRRREADRRHLALAPARARRRLRARASGRRLARVDRPARPSVSCWPSSRRARCCCSRSSRSGYFLADDLRHPDRDRPVLRGHGRGQHDHRPRRPRRPSPTAAGRLVFDDVHFRYQDSPERFPDLLDGVDLVIEPGETMALVGLTGSGKSTLTALTDAPLRRHRRLRLARRRRRARPGARRTAHATSPWRSKTPPCSRRRVRENVLLGRPDATEAELGRGARHRPGAVRLRPAERTRHDGRRRGAEPVGRAAPAPRARARGRRPARRCSCSTTRCRRSTSTPRRSSRRRSAGCSRRTTALIVAHRPSTVIPRRSRRAAARRPDHRGGHAQRALANNDHYRFVISSLDDRVAEPVTRTRRNGEPLMSSQSSVIGTRVRSATTSRAPRAVRSAPAASVCSGRCSRR